MVSGIWTWVPRRSRRGLVRRTAARCWGVAARHARPGLKATEVAPEEKVGRIAHGTARHGKAMVFAGSF